MVCAAPAARPRTHATVRGAEEAGERLARLTHELANLLDGSLRNLNIVLGLGRAAPAALVDTLPDIDKRLRSVRTALGQMATMVERASRAEGTPREGETRGERTNLTVLDACEHAVAMLEPLAGAAGAEVRLMIDEPARLLPADILYTVVSNGLKNALESIVAAGEGAAGAVQPRELGRVDVRVEFEAPPGAGCGGLITVEVMDNGLGLPGMAVSPAGDSTTAPRGARTTPGGRPVTPAPDARLFAPGFTTKAGGRGIGLALCSELVSERGGTIRLRPGEGGVGATLRVRWPVGVLPRGNSGA